MAAHDLGRLVLRVSCGMILLLHGIHKVRYGVGGIALQVEGAGLPGAFAYGVYLGEVVAPLLMILGYFTRPAALVFAANMAVAIALAHSHEVASLTGSGGWAIELPALLFFGGVSVALLGAGRFSLSRGRGRFD